VTGGTAGALASGKIRLGAGEKRHPDSAQVPEACRLATATNRVHATQEEMTMSLLSGRMRRRTFGISMIAFYILSFGMGFAGGVTQVMADAMSGKMPNFEQLNQPRWLFLALSLVLIAGLTLAMIRRLNDLQWGAWLGYLYGLFSVVSAVYMSLNFDSIMRASMSPATYTPAYLAINGFGIIAFIFFLVLVFKRGTVGPNSHGPDPSV
jgi:uncharacterized membrane protein YhaH (DUF805 family)